MDTLSKLRTECASVSIAESVLTETEARRNEIIADARAQKIPWRKLQAITGLSQPTLAKIVTREHQLSG